MVSRWWTQWLWSGQRRKHGQAIREVLAAWSPDPANNPKANTPWARDEQLVTGTLALLWQGASARDLSRWLEDYLERRHGVHGERNGIEDLGRDLVACYERRIFGDDESS